MILNKLQIGLVGLATFLLGIFVTTAVMLPKAPVTYYTYFCGNKGTTYLNITKYKFQNGTIIFDSVNFDQQQVQTTLVTTPGCLILEQLKWFSEQDVNNIIGKK